MRKLGLLAATALVAVPLALAAPAAQANWTRGNDYMIEFHNLTGNMIYEIYATNLDNPDWGWNRLNGQVLRHDWTIWIDVDDYSGYCVYDIMAVDQYGYEYEYWRINVCEVDHFDIGY